jgi:hypothetical protein
LRFRRTAGRLEVGYDALNPKGVSELQPVSGAGAALRDNALVITGTLPQASAWQYGARRMPATKDLGWSATTGYIPERFDPARCPRPLAPTNSAVPLVTRIVASRCSSARKANAANILPSIGERDLTADSILDAEKRVVTAIVDEPGQRP